MDQALFTRIGFILHWEITIGQLQAHSPVSKLLHAAGRRANITTSSKAPFISSPSTATQVSRSPFEHFGHKPNGSRQAWQPRLSQYNVVYFHHSPYSSGSEHGSGPTTQWPFKRWGTDVVLTGTRPRLRAAERMDPYSRQWSGGTIHLWHSTRPSPAAKYVITATIANNS